MPGLLRLPSVVKDTFYRADENPVYVGRWKTQNGVDSRILSKAVGSGVGDAVVAYRGQFAWDQFCEAVILDPTDNGVMVGLDRDAGWLLTTGAANLQFYRRDAGFNHIGTDTGWTTNAGDVLRLERVGQQLRGYINRKMLIRYQIPAAEWDIIRRAGNGAPGFFNFNSSAFTNFCGGNLRPTRNSPAVLGTDTGPVFAYVSANPSTLKEGLTGVVITGTGFGASQGTSQVQLDGVVQTVTAWSDTSITFDVVKPSPWASPRRLEVVKFH